ncbi:chromate efflux transporter [Leptospira gomenensis]|uniref:Chromate efflux transporter n=1 Tax=Leptospira gomenensis TaxID=2484974 RepID=A0A5F1YZM2_9LEPT|nr:chromate efflux transporter [Leptospira gomenensis]TGK27564.1 chromate efflux transporter [Leptospira gomenensis]TGK38224.1 chromate efflux transporter [Leptospira gomenensis]TGK42646.1 chromate efflux transporter [Leptospira gomenensis]TGK65809.1 chromate efflux transporter [Leptospira gomenensis]
MQTNKPEFWEAVGFWFRLGWISFGGPAGQIALMHKHLVEEKKWISEDRFTHALGYCMLLPGPEAGQLATYLGWMLYGTLGGIVAGFLFVLPSFFIFLGISSLYFYYGNVPFAVSFLNGVKPAVLSIVFVSFLNWIPKGIKTKGHWICFAATILGMSVLRIPYPYLLAFSMIFGIFSFFLSKQATKKKKSPSEEERFSIGIGEFSENVRRREENYKILKYMGGIGSAALILWAVPLLAILLFLRTEFSFWKDLILFFTKTALLTFGGAYAILPSVAEYATGPAGWISLGEMIDGLAFGESTPGPLVMVLTFIGFLAGAHRYDSILSGVLGLTLTAYYTFLPSFILILGGAPIVEKTTESVPLRFVLDYVTACVCAVILHLGIYFAKSVLLEPGASSDSCLGAPFSCVRWMPLFITVTGVLLLRWKKDISIYWIAAGGFLFLGIDLSYYL